MKQGEQAILLIGAGGHAAVVLDALRAGGFAGQVAVHALAAASDRLLDEPVHLSMPTPQSHSPAHWALHVAIGDNAVRARLNRSFAAEGYRLATVCHPSSVVSPHAEIGPGCAVLARAVVNPRARLAQGAIVNTAAVVEHDCSLGEGSHLSPGAIMAGNSHVGAESWIGAGTVLRQGVRVAGGIVVGASSVVLGNLDEPGTYIGRPAKPLQKEVAP